MDVQSRQKYSSQLRRRVSDVAYDEDYDEVIREHQIPILGTTAMFCLIMSEATRTENLCSFINSEPLTIH